MLLDMQVKYPKYMPCKVIVCLVHPGVTTFVFVLYLLFIVPPVLLQTLSTLRSLINYWLVGDGSSDSSPIRLIHN